MKKRRKKHATWGGNSGRKDKALHLKGAVTGRIMPLSIMTLRVVLMGIMTLIVMPLGIPLS
jgi:hypothetical protein